MCGITGWFSREPIGDFEPSVAVDFKHSKTQLEQMMHAIVHRGPDGQGTFFSKHAAMGHVRLSIIDLKSGQQPMQSYDQSVCISFNGEIYNYQALRHSLQSQGYRFNTNSDTEVIIALYQTMGIAGFSRLRGMFAFALWDEKSQSAYLVRDRAGIKPLFITHTKQQLLFGSEAKAILTSPQFKPELDVNSLHALMNFRYLPGNQSLFKGISQLDPGEIIQWQPNHDLIRSHIDPLDTQYEPDVLAAFDDSVRAHFTADVEVGCYLSGGIDSAAICAVGKSLLAKPYQLQTFTLDAGDDPMEANHAQCTANLLDIKNHTESIQFDPDLSLPEMLWHLETPKINALQIKLLSQVAASKVKVCLSGLGGDEAFYGYNVHRFMHQANQLYKILPKFCQRWTGILGEKLAQSFARAPFTEMGRKFSILRTLGQWPEVYGLMRNVWDSPKLRQLIYGPRMLDAALPDCFQQLEHMWPANTDPVAALVTFENRHKMVNDLLWQEDRMSMACGLEVRVPFVDQIFLHTMHKLDRQQLMQGGRPKSLMRQLFLPLLGKEIMQRPKSGFQVSSPDFFHQHLAGMAKQWLSPERITAYGLFNPDFVHKILHLKPAKRLRWHYFVLYLMLLTHLWIEIFENRIDHRQCQPRAA